ncbi:MAG: gamma-glutamyltransferase [Thiothrix sp.]|nr:MAG: gamma-glutamyltransferase [Thiothrix sp.]
MKRAALQLVPLAGLVSSILFFSTPSYAFQASDAVAPQISTTNSSKALVKAKEFMVASANPHASQAGLDILKAGGSAADAAIAIQLMLGLVEPQSSGLGGGAILLYWDNSAKKLIALDGRETAPKAIKPEVFLDKEGKPLKFMDAVVGGRSVGTPGTVKLLEHLHKNYGKLAWADLFKAPIALSEKGFAVTPHMAEQVAASAESLAKFPSTKAYFFNAEGQPLSAGVTRNNPEYAATLKLIAEQGAKGFYEGPIAQAIVDTVKNAPETAGSLSLEDLSAYTVKEREVVCMNYRAHDVCGMGAPTSGGIAMAQILGMLKEYDLAKLGADSPDSWRLIGDATRLAFADRNRYVADSDFVKVPTQGMLDANYLKQRSELLKGSTGLKTVEPGDFSAMTQSRVDDNSLELPSTSHFVVVDKAGNIVSMTTTIENGFGSRLMTNGFLLNNELTDFSFVAEENGQVVANRIEPNKRPRSSMSPTIVFKDKQPVLAIGSPGGSNIIAYTTNSVIGYLDWGMDIQQAVAMPHLVNRTGDYYLEKGTDAEKYQPVLEEMGYTVKVDNMNSGLHAIAIKADGLEGGADPRRDGVVLGQ